MSKHKYRVVFFGTPDFSVPTLEMLSRHDCVDLKLVVCSENKNAGRGLSIQIQPIAQFANDHKLPIIQTNNPNQSTELIDFFDKNSIDFCVVIAFSYFISDHFLAKAKYGFFNIHTSILPKYRGAGPIQAAILNGDTTTGVSIQKMVKKMDAGDVVFSEIIDIDPSEKYPELYSRLKLLSAVSLNRFLDNFDKFISNPKPQNESEVSFAPKILKDDGKLDFKNNKAQVILNKIRALNPWPSTFVFLNNKRLKILEANISYEKINLLPGETKFIGDSILVGTLDCPLQITSIQPEGKSVMSPKDLVNGLRGQSNDLKFT